MEFLVLTFPGETPGADAIGALARIRRSGDVRVADSVVVSRSWDGAISTAELADIEALRQIVAGRDLVDLIGAEDAEEIGQTLEPGTCALAVLIEHTWAAEAADAVRASGGRLAAAVRIPAENIDQAHRVALQHAGVSP